MTKLLELDLEAAKVFSLLMQNKYVVADGKATKRIVHGLRGAGVKVYNGYDQDARKVILAMQQNIKAVPQKRRLKSVIFGLKDI